MFDRIAMNPTVKKVNVPSSSASSFFVSIIGVSLSPSPGIARLPGASPSLAIRPAGLGRSRLDRVGRRRRPSAGRGRIVRACSVGPSSGRSSSRRSARRPSSPLTGGLGSGSPAASPSGASASPSGLGAATFEPLATPRRRARRQRPSPTARPTATPAPAGNAHAVRRPDARSTAQPVPRGAAPDGRSTVRGRQPPARRRASRSPGRTAGRGPGRPATPTSRRAGR